MPIQPPLFQPYRYTAGDPQQLPMRSPGDTHGPDYVVRATLLSNDTTGVILSGQTVTGQKARIKIDLVAPGVGRVFLETELSDPRRIRLARLPEKKVNVSSAISQQQIILTSEFLQIQINLDPFWIAFLTQEGRPLLEQNTNRRDLTGRFMTLPIGFSEVDGKRVAYHDSFDIEPDEHFYGGGEKFTNFDKRGQRLVMWNVDTSGILTEGAYKNVPFFISSKGYGIFVDSITATNLDFAASCSAILSLIVPDTALDYYVIAGPDPKTIIQRYSSLVSFPTLPPKWAFGIWLSSGWLADGDNEEKARTRARQMRTCQIPCDVMHLDSYWQKHGCWSDLAWDPKSFPDPAEMIRQLKSQGYKISLWMDPRIGIQSERFLEGKQNGYFLKDDKGETQIIDSWDGFHPPIANLDFTNPEAVAWFQQLIRQLLQIGVDVLKTDDGERVPNNAVASNGMTGLQIHNLYSLLYNDAVAEVIAQETGRAPLLWGRSSFSGGQRHSAQWGGDAGSSYQELAATLRGGLSLAMCGHAFWSHDIGGFGGHPSTDLYIRWSQFGLFSPLSRLHGITTRLPWDYGEEAVRIFRDFARLRYHLIPYLYTYACLAAETGVPILRPMWLEFPDDPNTYALDLQYMFGSEILVAPIYNRTGKRPVYLPAGTWVDYWSHEILQGPQTHWVEVPLDRFPLFIRGNALIPTIEPPEYLTEEPFPFVVFDAYLLDQADFTLRDLDGSVHMSVSLNGSTLQIRTDENKKKLGIRMLPLRVKLVVDKVLVNGDYLELSEKVDLSSSGQPGWGFDSEGVLQVILP